jgi:hypothetical protein
VLLIYWTLIEMDLLIFKVIVVVVVVVVVVVSFVIVVCRIH